jgi:hypothetical protein
VNAVLHPLQQHDLVRVQWACALPNQHLAVTLQGRERRSEVVKRPRQEIGAIQITFLQSKVGFH